MDAPETTHPRLAVELCLLVALALRYHEAFAWVAGTWRDATYESWGFLALGALLLRRLPPRRRHPSRGHMYGLAVVALADLALAPLGLNVLSAALGILSIHLWAVAFRSYPGRWYGHPQLWLGLLCLPAVYWANVLFGYHLQHLVTRLAAAGLGMYGLPVSSSGTLLQLPATVVAVDTSCSGLKLLYTGILFGVLAGPSGGVLRRGLFWGSLLGLLLWANVVRVMSLAAGHLHLGRPVGEAAHQAIGLVAFSMACALALLLARRLERRQRCRQQTTAATCEVHP